MDPTSELRERDALLERLSGLIEKEGIRNFSLESAARTIGFDVDRLAEYFPTATDLVVALIARNRINLRRQFVELDASIGSYDQFQRVMWNFYVENANASRVFFETYAMALFDEQYGEFFHGVNDWVDLLKESLKRRGFPKERADMVATLTLAVYRGAMMDLLATGDRPRVNAAMELWFKTVAWFSEPN